MNHKISVLLGVSALALAQLACNLPARSGESEGVATALPAPNQTLTALFAITPVSAASATLPPIYTATDSQSGGGLNPTATTAPATATTAPAATNTALPTVVVTPLATATRPPAATATQASRRTSFVAQYLSSPPTIDGDWGEWKDLTREYPANYVTYGAGSRTGEDDLASSFHIGWDANNLYVAVKVRDDHYVQNASGENIFEGDCIELLLDTNLQGDFYYDQLSPDDFQLGINPGRPDPSGTREAYLWFPSNIAGKRTSITIASRLENGVYRVEAAIPWNIFEVTPANGARYGFVISTSDNDNTSDNVQESMVSSSPNRRLADPTSWGELQLVR